MENDNEMIITTKKIRWYHFIISIILLIIGMYVFYLLSTSNLKYMDLIFGLVFGIILISYSAILQFNKGFEIDNQTREYRKIYFNKLLKIGTWKIWPEIKYISSFKTKEKWSITSSKTGNSTYQIYDVYVINLIQENEEIIELYRCDDAEDCIRKSSEFSDAFEAKLLSKI